MSELVLVVLGFCWDRLVIDETGWSDVTPGVTGVLGSSLSAVVEVLFVVDLVVVVSAAVGAETALAVRSEVGEGRTTVLSDPLDLESCTRLIVKLFERA